MVSARVREQRRIAANGGQEGGVRAAWRPVGAPPVYPPENPSARLTINDKQRSSACGVYADQRQVSTTDDKLGMIVVGNKGF